MAFINGTELNNHIELAHVELLLQCQSCNKVFKDKNAFSFHKEIHYQKLISG